MKLELLSPQSSTQIRQRDELLLSSLRDHALQWPFHAEYPLVLSHEDSQFSYGLYNDQQELIAHANAWPRSLKQSSSTKTYSLMFIGNVVTHPNFRGQGHTRHLMEHLVNIAQNQNLDALVLWSDLIEFYQKLGFTSNGREFRFTISRRNSSKFKPIQKINIKDLSHQDLRKMLELKPTLPWSIERSTLEFSALLGIPNCSLFVDQTSGRIESWLAIGKGSDMQGVIHEWGARSADELLVLCQSILNQYNIEELILLTPSMLPGKWSNTLKAVSKHVSEHPMCLARTVDPKNSQVLNALSQSFIWGLDSI